MNIPEVCLGQLGQRPKQLKQGLQSPDPYAHLGQLMSGDNALDVNDNGVHSKKRLPFSGGPHTKRTVGSGQDCILGCLLARKFCAGKSIQADPLQRPPWPAGGAIRAVCALSLVLGNSRFPKG